MEQEFVQCHGVEAAQEICMDFRRKIATYSESEFRVNMFIAAYPFVRNKNAARLDTNPVSPVPREPADTIVERTGKKLRAVLFDGGSPSPDVSRTVHIDHKNITKP